MLNTDYATALTSKGIMCYNLGGNTLHFQVLRTDF